MAQTPRSEPETASTRPGRAGSFGRSIARDPTRPSDWSRVRDQWETAHAVRFVLQLIGLGTLLLSIRAETPAGQQERAGVA